MSHPPRTSTALRRGFTLLEVLIAIGVVMLLVGLTVTAATSFLQHSEIKRTETTIRLLDMAVQEWESAAERPITWGDPVATGLHFDLDARTPEVLIVTELAQFLARQPNARAIIARLDPDHLFTYESGRFPIWARTAAIQDEIQARFVDGIAVLDAWGTPIYPTHPGAVYSPDFHPDTTPRDEDGTIRTTNEQRYGIARHRRICFVSAGPDRLFGLDNEFPGLAGDTLELAVSKARKDNIFSYRPLFADEIASESPYEYPEW